MPKTPNHDYNVPNKGESNWHIPLNENFEQYDTDIEIRDTGSNKENYDAKEDAKFLATDTGSIYVGDGSSWNHVDSTGQSPTLLGLNTDGDRLGIGMKNPEVPLDIRGQNNWNLSKGDGDVRIGDEQFRLAISVALGGAGRGTSRLNAKGGIERLKLGVGGSSIITVEEDTVTIDSDLNVNGRKNFIERIDTENGEKDVVYTATEAGTPHTEISGVAQLTDGRAEVELPNHFGWVTSDKEPLVVQTTPYGGSAGLKIVERSTDRLIIEDLDDEGDYEFSYTVKGTRKGQADKQVVRESSSEGAESTTPTLDHD